jgi:NAD(P)-dependent dehydrogenase (short-subunit alcohol dehydrogenase family)
MHQKDGYIALITGAGRGLGFEVAKQLSALGYRVLLGVRNTMHTAAQLAGTKMQDACILELDVTSAASIHNAYTYIDNTFGRLDVIVNNAGIMIDPGNFLLDTTLEISLQTLRDTFETNFFGAVSLTNTLVPLLLKSKRGRIVNVSTIMASMELHASNKGYALKKFAYNASKTALNAYTLHLANALRGNHIKVNAAHPGWVKTAMGTADAYLEIEEGAETIVQLATLDEDGPTGSFIHRRKKINW